MLPKRSTVFQSQSPFLLDSIALMSSLAFFGFEQITQDAQTTGCPSQWAELVSLSLYLPYSLYPPTHFSLSELTCFSWLLSSLTTASQKSPCIMARTSLRSPLDDPSFKAQAAAGEIRKERGEGHTHTLALTRRPLYSTL